MLEKNVSYLIDSNIFIYAANSRDASYEFLCDVGAFFYASITAIEVLGFHRITDAEQQDLNALFHKGEKLQLIENIERKTIILRKQYNIPLGDAIIAATALAYNLTLVTRNLEDFKGLSELHLYNPYD